MKVCVWNFLVLLLITISLTMVYATPTEDGRILYFEGKRHDANPLKAELDGGAKLQGESAACVRCHRPSGYGVNESDVRTAAITATTLFKPLTPRRDHLFRSLYQERHGVVAHMQARIPRSRPAYQNTSDILKAVRHGLDPAGKTLSPMMPRYEIDAEDAAALEAFLHTLGSEPPPGIDSETIHFATVLGPNIDVGRKEAMLKVMHAFINLHNEEVRNEKKRPDYSPLYKSELTHASRYWKLHIWTLPEEKELWTAALDKQYSRQPVFSMLGGIVKGAWKPLHEYCELRQLPCLFPQTDWPEPSPSKYNVYLSRGLPGEIKMLADRLKALKIKQVLQITGSDPEAITAATAFSDSTKQQGLVVETRNLSTFLNDNHLPVKTVIILWLQQEEFNAVNNTKILKKHNTILFASGSMLATENRKLPSNLPKNLEITWPYAIPGKEPARLYRLRKWLAARRVSDNHETTALNTYLVMDAVRHAMVHAVDRYSGEYLIEIIEHQIENLLNPGNYTRLSRV